MLTVQYEQQPQPETIRQIAQAASDFGFFILEGAPVDTIDQIFDYSKTYFNQPLDVKLSNQAKDGCDGYVPNGQERLDTVTIDQKEALNIRQPRNQSVQQFWKQCHNVAKWLLQVLAIGVGEGADYFTAGHFQQSSTTLRLLHYPASEQPVTAGLHTDYGSLTLLFQDDVGGLQVQTKEGQFVDIHATSIVVNIGDLLQEWTNNKLRSAPHRVVTNNKERYSVAMFIHPNDSQEVNGVTAKDYLQKKLWSTHSNK